MTWYFETLVVLQPPNNQIAEQNNCVEKKNSARHHGPLRNVHLYNRMSEVPMTLWVYFSCFVSMLGNICSRSPTIIACHGSCQCIAITFHHWALLWVPAWLTKGMHTFFVIDIGCVGLSICILTHECKLVFEAATSLHVGTDHQLNNVVINDKWHCSIALILHIENMGYITTTSGTTVPW